MRHKKPKGNSVKWKHLQCIFPEKRGKKRRWQNMWDVVMLIPLRLNSEGRYRCTGVWSPLLQVMVVQEACCQATTQLSERGRELAPCLGIHQFQTIPSYRNQPSSFRSITIVSHGSKCILLLSLLRFKILRMLYIIGMMKFCYSLMMI